MADFQFRTLAVFASPLLNNQLRRDGPSSGIISNTNIILGRPGLEDLECVISPRHLCIKFPTPHGVGIARGSQRVSRAWYLKATKQPIKYDTQVGEVTAQLLRAKEKHPRVEVAGDIEEVELEPGTPGRFVRIGKGLGAELRWRVISVLRRFRKVFAWSPADMPGLDHKIVVHRLNVVRDAKQVKKKRRHLSQERRDFVKKAHRIVVLTNEPLASLTRSPAASARMTKWAVFISQYNVEFRLRPSIKGQALADFQLECTTREMTRAQAGTQVEDDWWVMSIDRSSGSCEATYPQANGQVENVNRTIISGIKKKLLSEGSKWVDELPRILWTYRTTPRTATGDTPFGLAYSFEAQAPAETLIPTRREMEYEPEENEQNQAVEVNFIEE
ncbi:unnamed protein product [Cuscuta campestris]|uniref:Integrase catalytic domain-containing protein n=1 Tax=Cuscuta campestris TaxID=132261 RepID=A0A484L9Z9_9ASTE|nr:unnamed protein product [Cuscuta campestris]